MAQFRFYGILNFYGILTLKIEHIDVDATVQSVKDALQTERNLSPTFKSSLVDLLFVVDALLKRLSLNSSNSSKAPSTDPNREKKNKKGQSEKKPGGQKGHVGSTLEPVDNPDEIIHLSVDASTLPKGVTCKAAGFITRQVIDVRIRRHVIEYRAQILEDPQGKRYTAEFPAGLNNRSVQYGPELKATAVYMSLFQLIPYDRVRDYFTDQLGIPISAGSLFNFNKESFTELVDFDSWVKGKLTQSTLIHLDETGINIDGKRHWLHCACNKDYTHFYPHKSRGVIAIDEAGIVQHFKGKACHDHLKAYYTYTDCLHVLCNAHHLRELERAWEQDAQKWAKNMKRFLVKLNKAVEASNGQLPEDEAQKWRTRYRSLLKRAEKECPEAPDTRAKGSKGPMAQSKSRNLLVRLRDYESDVLRFIDDDSVPFTNNQAENDLRMTKVQQKISGCFRSMEGAKIFCRVRSYIGTCRKQGITATEALSLLFQGKSPDFMA